MLEPHQPPLRKADVTGSAFTHLGLFEGIGGFSLAAHWMGWQTLAWCEWNEFGQRILKHHFPNAEGFGDITKTDFTKYANRIDILTGGFPCQPYSLAGKRKGKEDERHLWPEMLRAIREIQPPYVVGENVFGLINWNGGMVFNEVQADLEAAGYDVLPFLLPACGVGAPHRRDRIWFVAHAEEQRLQHTGSTRDGMDGSSHGNSSRVAADTDSNGLEGSLSTIEYQQSRIPEGDASECLSAHQRRIRFQGFPTQSPVCGGDDGLPRELDGITFSKWRQESIKGYGNAVVPQVVIQLFKVIQTIETQ